MKKRRRKTSIRIIWLLSFLCVLFIPTVVNLLVYSFAIEAVWEEVIEKNQLSFQRLFSALDNETLTLQKIYMQLVMDPAIQRYLKGNYDSFPDEVLDAYEIVKKIRASKMNSPNPVCLYFKRNDRIITDSAVYELPLFYRVNGEDLGLLPFGQWSELLGSIHQQHYFQGGDHNLVFMQSLPIHSAKNPDGAMILYYNQEVVRSFAADITSMNGGSFAILNQGGQYIFKTEKWPEAFQLQPFNGTVEQADGYVILRKKSEINKWTYLLLLPEHVYMQSVYFIRYFLLAGIVSSVAAGVLLALVFSKRHYSPIQKLMHQFQPTAGYIRKQPGTGNEFDFLQQEIQKAQEARNTSEEMLQKQSDIVRSQFLVAAFEGQLGRTEPLEQIYRDYGIQPKRRDYALIRFEVNPCETAGAADASMDASSLFQFNIAEMSERFTDDAIDVYFAKGSGFLCALCFADRCHTSMQETAEQIQAALQALFSNYDITCGISRWENDLTKVPKAFIQATRACEHKTLLGNGCLVTYEDVADTVFRYSFVEADKQEIIRCLLIGKTEKALEQFYTVYRDNLLAPKASPAVFKCLQTDVLTLFHRLIHKAGVTDAEFSGKVLQGISSAETARQLWKRMQVLIDEISGMLNAYRKSHNYQLRDDIILYIRSHYWDGNLSASMIADHFGINPAYLSTFFREQTGERLLDHINQTRVEAAKQLLMHNERSLDDIAAKVGLNDSHALIRVFKRYIGMTPGHYRQQQ